MTDDLMEQLASRNPVPDDLPALPLDSILARVGRLPASVPRDRPHRRVKPRSMSGVAVACLSVLVVAGVSVVLLSADHRSNQRSAQGPTQAGPVVDLRVFERPQTARDRTLFSVARQAARRAHDGARFADDWLDGVIPSQTRYVRTISGGREVFLAVLTNGSARQLVQNPNARPARTRDGEVALKLIIVQPDGRATTAQGPIRQPIDGGGLGYVNNRIAGIEARAGGGCSGVTVWSLMPNGISRVRWQFPRQDRYGNTYPTPLSVTVPAQDNLAIATIHGRASCDKPTVTTLYDANGHVVDRYGNPAPLRRVPAHAAQHSPSTSAFCRENPSACPGAATTTPGFATNAAGETYGSASGVLPAQEPDLIAARGRGLHGNQHVSGYVRKTQLEADSCANVATPRAAVRCTKTHRHLHRTIPIYTKNGTTIIGAFTVGAATTRP